MKEWMNWADFLAYLYIFRKAKSYSNIYWVGAVKYGCELLHYGTLKYAVAQ